MKLTTSDRINFSIAALKQHVGLILLSIPFLVIGSILIYIGLEYENTTPLIYMGGFFIIFTLFFMGYTLPSSIMHYYEKSVIKKYGTYTNAIVIDKKIEDYSYTNTFDGHTSVVKEHHYYFTYKFTYQKEYTSSFFIKSLFCYEKINIGSEIPIKFLKTKPEQSEPRRRKLCKDLGLDSKDCQ